MRHFIKYNIIGILNTLITLVVVWILHQCLDVDLVVSNFLGFIAGGINSYLCNRIWNFKSVNRKKAEVIRFLIVFICSYGVNLLVLEGCVYVLQNCDALASFVALVEKYVKPTYLANVIANVAYVLVSYTLYKKWVFKPVA